MMKKGTSRLANHLALAMFFAVSSASAEELVVPGSGNNEFVVRELAKAFNARQTQHRVTVQPSSGMAGAVRDVSEGVSSLGRVGRPLRDVELAKGLAYLPLGRDAIAVAGGAAVTARKISTEQLKAVFSGKITEWTALGGQQAPIRVIGKESTDAIRSQITAHFKDLAYADTVKIAHLDTQLLELLDRYPTSFAIINHSALGACKTKVVTLALDGVEPSLDNIANGRYPLIMEFGLIHKTTGLSPASKAFIEFIRSADGEKTLRSYGVVPKNTGT